MHAHKQSYVWMQRGEHIQLTLSSIEAKKIIASIDHLLDKVGFMLPSFIETLMRSIKHELQRALRS